MCDSIAISTNFKLQICRHCSLTMTKLSVGIQIVWCDQHMPSERHSSTTDSTTSPISNKSIPSTLTTTSIVSSEMDLAVSSKKACWTEDGSMMNSSAIDCDESVKESILLPIIFSSLLPDQAKFSNGETVRSPPTAPCTWAWTELWRMLLIPRRIQAGQIRIYANLALCRVSLRLANRVSLYTCIHICRHASIMMHLRMTLSINVNNDCGRGTIRIWLRWRMRYGVECKMAWACRI